MKDNKKKNKEKTKVTTIIKYALGGIQGIISVIFLFMLAKLDMLPTKYFLAIAAILIVLCAGNILLQSKKVIGVCMNILGIIVSIILVIGSIYVYKTTDVRDRITGAKTQIDEIVVYVMNDDVAKTIGDASDYNFGILEEKGREATDSAIKDINEMVKKQIITKGYADVFSMVDGLYSKEVNAIIMNKAYLDIITEQEGYEDFESKTKQLISTEVKTEIKWEEPVEDVDTSGYFALNKDVFTLYISGIDTYGSVAKTSRSDVNIIAVVNTKTKQLLLISTPRDYYVPLSVSNGVKDKLTHAGIYGINCSKDTLSSIYNVELQYYFRLNFDGFIDIIDALGGVTVYSNEEFTTRHGSYHITKGNNTLNGDQALGFARERYSLANGDRQRGKNQMEVIKSVINEMTSSSILYNYLDVMEGISGCFQTSMPADKINSLVKMQINDMAKWNIVSYSVDGTGTRATTYSMPGTNAYVMVPDDATIEKAKELIQKVINGEIITE